MCGEPRRVIANVCFWLTFRSQFVDVAEQKKELKVSAALAIVGNSFFGLELRVR
jgi:hypothetical protein